MEDYKGNSFASKQNEEKKNEITIGGTKKQSGLTSFGKSVISEDAGTVGKRIKDDVLIPSIKKTIVDVVKSAIDWFIYGVRGNPNQQRSVGSNIILGSYWQRQQGYQNSVPSYASAIGNNVGFQLNPVEFPDRGSVEECLLAVRDTMNIYGTVSCAAYLEIAKKILSRYYDNVNIKCPFTAEKYGWRDLSTASAVPTNNGTFIINFPKIQQLD